MSDRDPLDPAFHAMRELTSGESDASDETLARIVATLNQRNRTRVRIVRWLLPIAAILVGSTAWATVTGRLPSLVGRWLEHISESQPGTNGAPDVPSKPPAYRGRPADAGEPKLMHEDLSSPAAEPGVASGAEPGAEPGAETGAETSAAAESPSPPPPPNTTQPSAVRPRVSAPLTPARSPDQPSAVEPKPTAPNAHAARFDPLYREAHEAHFVKNDPALAADLWQHYLQAKPQSPLAPEARYNRAIALLRLGRRSEAVSMLAPFAEGEFDGYRQAEAQSLIDAVRDAGQAR